MSVSRCVSDVHKWTVTPPRCITIFSNRKKYYSGCFSCNVFLGMSLVTAATTIPPVIVVCSRAITMTVTLVPTAVGLPASGQDDVHTAVDLDALGQFDVILPPQLILRDTMGSFVGPTTVPQE